MTMAFLSFASVPPPPLAALSDDDGLPFLYLRLRWLLSAMTMAFLCITYDANTTNGATIDTTNGIGTTNGTTIATPPPPPPLWTTMATAALHADFAWPGLPPVHNLLRAWSTAPAGHLHLSSARPLALSSPQPDYPLGIRTSLVTMPQVSVLYSATMVVSHRVWCSCSAQPEQGADNKR